jgi:predicted O-linked N-acetylglucosamine transferase (SPINDLY family)
MSNDLAPGTTLYIEATQLEVQGQWGLAQTSRERIRALYPKDIDNLLHLVLLALKLETLTEQILRELNLLAQLQADPSPEFDKELLLTTTWQLLTQRPDLNQTAELARIALPYITDPKPWLTLVRPWLRKLVSQQQKYLAVDYANFCIALDGDNLDLIRQVIPIYITGSAGAKAMELAEQLAHRSQTFPDQLLVNLCHLTCGMWKEGYWDAALNYRDRQLDLLESLLSQEQDNFQELLDPDLLAPSLFFLPYFEDCPAKHHSLRQRVGRFYQTHLQNFLAAHLRQFSGSNAARLPLTHRKLRIGYLGYSLRRQSVGWLSRWLFAHHDHDQFEIYTYFNQQTKLQEFSQEWFAVRSDEWRAMDEDIAMIARRIQGDEIDILVDVDSVTRGVTYGVMALKPAPIQITWLGWDAPGLPTVDYFIADPYVLPENAQDYYSETIWRLPQTYIAVDGFEVDVANYRREQLKIPPDAVVYLNNQTPHKLHPDFLRMHIQILREVPGSYLLIKRWSEKDKMEKFYGDLAESEGVSRDRIRFLPIAPIEPAYRANIALADVVLDCYPYNGATTTLETLWMGVPVVTKVGEQFQARNSYTMMMNAGITEGIAWNDAEYLDWAVRFGTDETLRQQVYLKLMRSRQTASLWNARQFTRNMETAYKHMWDIYC